MNPPTIHSADCTERYYASIRQILKNFDINVLMFI